MVGKIDFSDKKDMYTSVKSDNTTSSDYYNTTSEYIYFDDDSNTIWIMWD